MRFSFAFSRNSLSQSSAIHAPLKELRQLVFVAYATSRFFAYLRVHHPIRRSDEVGSEPCFPWYPVLLSPLLFFELAAPQSPRRSADLFCWDASGTVEEVDGFSFFFSSFLLHRPRLGAFLTSAVVIAESSVILGCSSPKRFS